MPHRLHRDADECRRLPDRDSVHHPPSLPCALARRLGTPRPSVWKGHVAVVELGDARFVFYPMHDPKGQLLQAYGRNRCSARRLSRSACPPPNTSSTSLCWAFRNAAAMDRSASSTQFSDGGQGLAAVGCAVHQRRVAHCGAVVGDDGAAVGGHHEHSQAVIHAGMPVGVRRAHFGQQRAGRSLPPASAEMNVWRSLVVEIMSPPVEIQEGLWRVTSIVFCVAGVFVAVVGVGVRFGDLRRGVRHHGARQAERPQDPPLHLLGAASGR